MKFKLGGSSVLFLALFFACATLPVRAQEEPVKQNRRTAPPAPQPPAEKAVKTNAAPAEYSYDFSQPNFYVKHIHIVHDANGRGQLTFEKIDGGEPITEPLQLSDAARARILGLFETLRFIDSDTSYQSEHQFPHLGTMKVGMKQGERERIAEFNWTSDKDAAALVQEYRRVANQAIFIFNITLSRQNQPLEAPKLMDELEGLYTRKELSDTAQLIPLLEDLTNDERIPLIARNHAARLAKKMQKN